MRPGNTALLVVAAAGVDQHIKTIDVQQIAAYLDAENRSLRIHREFIAPVPRLQRRQVFAGHARYGELHGHAALAFANTLDLELAQLPSHELSPIVIPPNPLTAYVGRISLGRSIRVTAAYHRRARDVGAN